MNYEFCCPTLFGLEGIVGDELRHNGGLTDVRVENGRVFFLAKNIHWHGPISICAAQSAC